MLPNHSLKSGFTLIELLVVIAVIAILAAILFPVFAQAREKARQTSCLSNSRQYASAILMYAQDYDETFPMAAYPSADGVVTVYLAIDPYVRNKQVAVCPSEAMAMKMVDFFGYVAPNTPAYVSYGANLGLFVTNGFGGPLQVVPSLASIPRVAETVMTYDANVTISPSMDRSSSVQARHSGFFVANYSDGHAKSIQATDTGTTAPQFLVSLTGATVPGRAIEIYRIGIQGGYYAGMTQCLGIPQDL